MKRWIVIYIALSCVTNIYSQVISSLQVDKDTVIVGEDLDLYINIQINNSNTSYSIDYSTFDSIPVELINADQQLEVIKADIDWGRDFTISNNRNILLNQKNTTLFNNKSIYKDTIKATVWDEGKITFRHPNVNSNNTPVNVSRSIPVSVIAVSGVTEIASDTLSAIRPIHDIIKEGVSLEDYLWLAYLLAAIFIAFILFYFLFIKPKVEDPIDQPIIEIQRPAHVIALEKLDQLKNESLWTKGQVKQHQTRFTYSIREYLENRFEINALESTTDEIAKSLKQQSFEVKHENDLREMLQIADLVKFAKAEPATDLNLSFLEKAVKFINETKKEEDIAKAEELYEKQLTENLGEIIYAQWWQRLAAYIIDNLISFGLSSIIFILLINVLTHFENFLLGALIIPLITCIFFITFNLIYFIYAEAKYGKTIGKRILKIKVVNQQRNLISLGRSILRNILKAISPSFLFIPFFSIFFTKKNQTVHDIIGDSIVIKEASNSQSIKST